MCYFNNLQVGEIAHLHDKPGVGSDGSLACRIFLHGSRCQATYRLPSTEFGPQKTVDNTPKVSQFAPEKGRTVPQKDGQYSSNYHFSGGYVNFRGGVVGVVDSKTPIFGTKKTREDQSTKPKNFPCRMLNSTNERRPRNAGLIDTGKAASKFTVLHK